MITGSLAETADEKQNEAMAHLMAKLKVVHENATRNLGALLNGEPDQEYIWVNNTPDAIAKMQGYGYTIVKDPKTKKNPTFAEQWKQRDGSFIRGSLIAMSASKEIHEVRKMYGELKAVEALYNNRKPLLNKARQAGIRVEIAEDDGVSRS